MAEGNHQELKNSPSLLMSTGDCFRVGSCGEYCDAVLRCAVDEGWGDMHDGGGV